MRLAYRTMVRKVSAPTLCPIFRGSPRRLAHRPLPSIMTPTWAGRLEKSGILQLHDLFFFFLCHQIDVLAVFIGELLGFLLAVLQVVFGQLAVFLHGFEFLHQIPADAADCHLRLLTVFADVLSQVPAALLRQRRKHDPQDLPVVVGDSAVV